MPPPSPSLGLTITNPLVLYRTLLATKQIDPDPAQHRLALHLQKVYNRLQSYNPEVDYNYRLDQINRAVGNPLPSSAQLENPPDSLPNGRLKGIFSSFRVQSQDRDTLAITKKLTSHESAIKLQSPQGLLLYGDVGTGKSMLVDLLADCLPAQKKRRWHFNNFVLEIFAKLEQLRRKRFHASSNENGKRGNDEEHSLLCIARDLISTSPILFLDEFQLPDRASSKLLTNLLTPFFHLGGVLIATSNRMPEELANASGVEFAAPPSSRLGMLKSRWGLLGAGIPSGRSESSPGKGDFALFLDVLRARCEIWDMDGSKDWRRREIEDDMYSAQTKKMEDTVTNNGTRAEGVESIALENGGKAYAHMSFQNKDESKEEKYISDPLPSYYFMRNLPLDSEVVTIDPDLSWTAALHSAVSKTPPSFPSAAEIPWKPTSLHIYGRTLFVPRHLRGVTYWAFSELCCTNLGPADYISLASTFHTIILTDVPILTLLHKNEARRLITLLDALYEARCKLLVRAAAGPDTIFFPEQTHPSSTSNPDLDPTTEAIHPETFSEIYQDQISPFRPNTSSTYTPSTSTPSYLSPSSTPRSILADEDSDFGPLPYSKHPPTSDGPPGAGNEIGKPDFSNTMAFTGEDERFAYKRARSRLWEMCSARWWARAGEPEEWWRPLPPESMLWEGRETAAAAAAAAVAPEVVLRAGGETKERESKNDDDEGLFRHGASPFRVHGEPPPKFGWTHAWGMMRWGKKAGTWGKGVDGLDERRRGGDVGERSKEWKR